MAKYRHVYTDFWTDPDVLDLTAEQTYFFLWLLTSPKTKQCGIIEAHPREIAFELKHSNDNVVLLLEQFEEKGKVKWSRETHEIAIKNFWKRNFTGSSKLIQCAIKELEGVKNKSLVDYIYGLSEAIDGFSKSKGMGTDRVSDTLSIPYGEKEKEKENKKEKEDMGLATSGEVTLSANADASSSSDKKDRRYMSQEEKDNEDLENALSKTDKKIDYMFWLDFYNEVNGGNCKITTARRKKIASALKELTEQELMATIKFRGKDKCWLDPETGKHKAKWDAFWRSKERVLKWYEKMMEAKQTHKRYQEIKKSEAYARGHDVWIPTA